MSTIYLSPSNNIGFDKFIERYKLNHSKLVYKNYNENPAYNLKEAEYAIFWLPNNRFEERLIDLAKETLAELFLASFYKIPIFIAYKTRDSSYNIYEAEVRKDYIKGIAGTAMPFYFFNTPSTNPSNFLEFLGVEPIKKIEYQNNLILLCS